jgi:hypothetical protein
MLGGFIPKTSYTVNALKVLKLAWEDTMSTAKTGLSNFSELADTVIESAASLADTLTDVEYAAKLSINAFTGIGAIQPFISNIAQTEQQLIQLKTSLQSTTLGVQEYLKAMEFAARTPFAVGQVIRSATLLRTFQFDPFMKPYEDKPVMQGYAKDGRELIHVLGDMAGAMGRDVALAAHALNRAMVAEWEIMQNNFQISARMIPKLAGLRSGTKEYGDAIIEFLYKQNRFRGGMELTAKSMTGLISDISDAFDILKTFIGGTPDAEGALKGFTFYDRIRDNLKLLYNTVSDSAPSDAVVKLKNDIIDLQKVINDLDKEKPTKKRTTQMIKEDIDKNKEKLESVSKDLVRNYERLSGIFLNADSLGVSKLDAGKKIEKSLDAFYNYAKENNINYKKASDMFDHFYRYLAKTSDEELKLDPNMFRSQIEKLQLWGRIIGQILGAFYDIIATPLVDIANNASRSILDAAGNFLDGLMGGAFSIDNIMKKGAKDNAQAVTKGSNEYMRLANEYLNMKVTLSSEEFQKLSQDVERILEKSESAMTKQYMIFAVVVQLMVQFVKLKFKELVETNPTVMLFKEFFNELTDTIPKTLQLVKDSIEKFFKENSNIFNVLKRILNDATDGLLDFGEALDSELEDGGGPMMNALVQNLKLAAGYILLMAVNWLKASKASAIFGLTTSNMLADLQVLMSTFRGAFYSTIGQFLPGVDAEAGLQIAKSDAQMAAAQRKVNERMIETLNLIDTQGLDKLEKLGFDLLMGKDINTEKGPLSDEATNEELEKSKKRRASIREKRQKYKESSSGSWGEPETETTKKVEKLGNGLKNTVDAVVEDVKNTEESIKNIAKDSSSKTYSAEEFNRRVKEFTEKTRDFSQKEKTTDKFDRFGGMTSEKVKEAAEKTTQKVDKLGEASEKTKDSIKKIDSELLTFSSRMFDLNKTLGKEMVDNVKVINNALRPLPATSYNRVVNFSSYKPMGFTERDMPNSLFKPFFNPTKPYSTLANNTMPDLSLSPLNFPSATQAAQPYSSRSVMDEGSYIITNHFKIDIKVEGNLDRNSVNDLTNYLNTSIPPLRR